MDKGPNFNPFLPYDKRGFIKELNVEDELEDNHHVLLFNKFSIVPNHLLVITKVYESQDTLVRESTFKAIFGVMQELAEPGVEWLCFFNCGKDSGASQHHKHLQLLPMVNTEIPVEAILPTDLKVGKAGWIPAYQRSFEHEFVWLGDDLSGEHLKMRYDTIMKNLKFPPAYNLLFTRRWMLVVPRRAPVCTDGLSFNSLAYAGLFTVKSEEELVQFKARKGGPIAALRELAYPIIYYG